MIDLYEDIYNVQEKAKNTVLIIGNFDGVHVGHQKLIASTKKIANEENLKLALMTFTPHPKKFFTPDCEPFSITSCDTKIQLFEEFGIDIVFKIHLDTEFTSILANNFIKDILVDKLRIKHLFVGENFKFGNKKEGNISHLEEAYNNNMFNLTTVELSKADSQHICSSTLVRKYLSDGNFAKAEPFPPLSR